MVLARMAYREGLVVDCMQVGQGSKSCVDEGLAHTLTVGCVQGCRAVCLRDLLRH